LVLVNQASGASNKVDTYPIHLQRTPHKDDEDQEQQHMAQQITGIASTSRSLSTHQMTPLMISAALSAKA
jgi:hypothetical protein